MPARPVLSIIIPCYNPDPDWEKIVVQKSEELRNAIPGADIRTIIINDGSTSGINPEIIGDLKNNINDLQWISYDQNKGKGYALRKALEPAGGDFYIYTDIDFPYTIESMAGLYSVLVQGADVAVGVRETEYYQKVPQRRVIISKVLKRLIRHLLDIPITDTQCGLKGFNNKGKQVFLKTTINRFLFDMQFVQTATHRNDLIVKPVTVYSRPGIIFSHMTYRILLRETFNFLWLAIPFGEKRE
jgi:glycosyltransferase involved in cell wall biosynthesis